MAEGVFQSLWDGASLFCIGLCPSILLLEANCLCSFAHPRILFQSVYAVLTWDLGGGCEGVTILGSREGTATVPDPALEAPCALDLLPQRVHQRVCWAEFVWTNAMIVMELSSRKGIFASVLLLEKHQVMLH